jgi:hypothetical protein
MYTTLFAYEEENAGILCDAAWSLESINTPASNITKAGRLRTGGHKLWSIPVEQLG